MAKKPYNGHESYNAWNVALWVGNDEYLYKLATTLDCGLFCKQLLKIMPRTPDNVKVSLNTAKLAWKGVNEV